MRTVLDKDIDPRLFKEKLNVVKKMLLLNVDNRTLNGMRESMNNKIEDEQGLMKKEDFKNMMFTAFGKKNREKSESIYLMLYPLIKENSTENDLGDQEYVSIGKLSMFIDFFNYYPFKTSNTRHKNDTSENL